MSIKGLHSDNTTVANTSSLEIPQLRELFDRLNPSVEGCVRPPSPAILVSVSSKSQSASIMNRTCKLCGNSKPLTTEYFGRTKTSFRFQCRVCLNARNARWQKANKDKVLANTKRRQALVANASGDVKAKGSTVELTNEQLDFLFQKTNGVCVYCLKQISKETAQPDHKIPISRGGTNHLSNFTLICKICNRDKHNKTVEEYLVFLNKWS